MYIFQIAIVLKKGKFRMKCVEKYNAHAKGTIQIFLDMLIDHHNLLWNINLPDFQQNSKFPWHVLKIHWPWILCGNMALPDWSGGKSGKRENLRQEKILIWGDRQ